MTQTSLLRAMALVPLLGGCFDGAGFDFIADGPFPVFQETSTTKEVTLTLDDLNPVQRFSLRAEVAPSSFDAHVDATVGRTSRGFLLELVEEQFASADPANWPFADVGFVFQARSQGTGVDQLRLSVARQAQDNGQQVSIDLSLALAAPTDVDFDGVEDDVDVDLGALDPVILE